MSEEIIDTTKPIKSKKLCAGIDIGTGTIQVARSDQDTVNITRNAFLELNKDDISVSDLSDISYVESDDGKIFIIGDDAFRLANIFSKEVQKIVEVKAAQANWHMGVMGGITPQFLPSPQVQAWAVGGEVERRIVGPFWLGLWGMGNTIGQGSGGLKVGVEF